MSNFLGGRGDQRSGPILQGGGIQYQFLYPGAFTMVRVVLGQGQSIKAQSDAMVAMTGAVEVKGKLEGGILGGLGRMLTGETFFFQTLSASRGPGEVLLSPSRLGDVIDIELDGSMNCVLQKDGFFAATEGVQISTTMQNLSKGLFSGEGFFVIKASGKGMLFVESYGAIHTIEIPANEEVVIDNQHLVAWPDGLNYRIEKASSSGWISSLTSGEGLVCRFRGPGTVFIQSRNPSGFATWIGKMLPAK
jgi:uncharacterized protein (TIGR00266 family)